MVVKGSEIGITYIVCDHPGCTDQFKLTHWDSIAASDKGWFQKLNGEAWCPEHIPSWVAEWRAKKRGDYLGS